MDKTDIVVLWVDGNDPQWQAEKKSTKQQSLTTQTQTIDFATGV